MVGTHELPTFERKLGLSAAQTRRALAFGTAILSLALMVDQPASLAHRLLQKVSARIDIVLQLTPSTGEQLQEPTEQRASLEQEFLSSDLVRAFSALGRH